VQPLIRYDLGDRVTLRPDACPCGSRLPVIDIEGRCDDTLQLGSADGRRVQVLPLALSTVLEEEAGLFDFQLVQKGMSELELCCGASGRDADAALRRGRMALAGFLARQGAAPVRIRCHSGRPPRRGRTGKIKRVVILA